MDLHHNHKTDQQSLTSHDSLSIEALENDAWLTLYVNKALQESLIPDVHWFFVSYGKSPQLAHRSL